MPVRPHPNRPKRFRARYRIRNWPQYDAGLKRRGDLTLWLDEAAIAGWQAARRTTPGGQARYSDLAIELVLILRLVFHLALRQVEGTIASVTADGAYDGDPVYQAVARRQPDPPPDIVIPPRSSAVPSTTGDDGRSQRDRHIQLIRNQGRMDWQRVTGYGRRSLVETAIGRYKASIGPRLRA